MAMNSRMPSYFFFVLLLGAAAATVFIFVPFLTPLVLATAAAILVYPVYYRLAKFFGTGGFAQTMAALVTVILVLTIVLVPIFLLVGSIYAEIQTLYTSLTDEGSRSAIINTLNTLSAYLSKLVFGVLPQYSFDSLNVTDYIKGGLEAVFNNLDTIFKRLVEVGAYVFIFLLALFYFLRDGASLVKRVFSWSPLLENNSQFIVRTINKATQSVFEGTMAVGIIDGLSIGLSFLVFGIPAPALWGTLAAVAALVPGFGVMLIAIPGAIYLILAQQYWFAAGLIIWGYTTILISDHIIGPTLINRGVKIHPFLVLLSVLGGIIGFGIVGFLLGPLILVFLFALLDIYRFSFSKKT